MQNNDKYLIGNRKLMTENGVIIPNEQDEQQLVNDGNSILFVSLNNKLVALIGVKDILKDNIENVIKELKDKNINVVMLTGDNEKTAEIVAKQIGIEKVISNVTPKEKAEKIKELKKDGIVIMCGDGINDSISLVTADIGVSISSGTDIAMDSASVILMNDNIEKINELIEISARTIKNIKQNLFWSQHIKDKIIDKLSPFVSVSVLWDSTNLLGYKDSPTDRGKETLLKLMENKIYVGTNQ